MERLDYYGKDFNAFVLGLNAEFLKDIKYHFVDIDAPLSGVIVGGLYFNVETHRVESAV